MFSTFLVSRVYDFFVSPTLMITLGFALDRSVPPTLCVLFNLFSFFFFSWTLRQFHSVFFAPLNLYREAGSVGYVNHDPRVSMEQNVRNTQMRKKIGQTPPPFPNGWFRVLDSSMLQKERVKSVYAFGKQLAVFRNKRGAVRIMDAYCPHLGANMAVGGKVVNNDCLECPFHGWQFSGETGKLVNIPYAKKVPSFVSVKTWPCCEINEVIYIWHHNEGVEPQWRMPQAPSLDQLKHVGRTEHIINAHIEDIPENAADLAHLDHLHKPVVGNDVEVTNESVLNNLIKHGIIAFWRTLDNPAEKHRSEMSITDNIYFQYSKYKLPLITLKFHADQIGPGAVYISVETPFFWGLIIQSVTPIEEYQQRLSHSFYISPYIPICVGKAFYLLETTQIERDILMWNNKTYLNQPVLVKEEALLGKHRRWYQQFYSKPSKYEDESSQSHVFEASSSLDW